MGYSFCAIHGSTVVHVVRQLPGCFGRIFYVKVGARSLKSILSCSPEDVAALVVDGNGMCLLVLVVTLHLLLGFLQYWQAWLW